MRLLAVLLAVVVAVGASAAPVPKELKKKRSDAEVFAGEWQVVSTERNGQPQANHANVWTIDADLKMKTIHPSGQVLNWTLKIDPEKTPKEIELTSYKGIYEIDGDEIRLVYSNQRPANFDDKARNNYTVLRRAEKK